MHGDATIFQASNVLSLDAGQFTVTARDANGCVRTSKVNITLTNDLTLQVRGDTTICAGGSVRLIQQVRLLHICGHPLLDLIMQPLPALRPHRIYQLPIR